jgi:hypothetical protein
MRQPDHFSGHGPAQFGYTGTQGSVLAEANDLAALKETLSLHDTNQTVSGVTGTNHVRPSVWVGV